MRQPRILLAAGVVVMAAVIGIAIAVSGGGDGSGSAGKSDAPRRVTRAQLTLEQSRRPDSGARELIVSSPGPQLNTLALTGGTTLVELRCFDAGGAVALSQKVEWPLLEEPGYPPHTHQPAERRLLERIRRCRLTGPGIAFEGAVPGPLPSSR